REERTGRGHRQRASEERGHVVAERDGAEQERPGIRNDRLEEEPFAESPGVRIRSEDALVPVPRPALVEAVPRPAQHGRTDRRVPESAIDRRRAARDRLQGVARDGAKEKERAEERGRGEEEPERFPREKSGAAHDIPSAEKSASRNAARASIGPSWPT